MDITLLFAALDEKEKDVLYHLMKKVTPKNPNPPQFTPIKKFVEEADLPLRVRNILIGYRGKYTEDEMPFKFLEQVTRSGFLKIRNAGKRSWNDFLVAKAEYLEKKAKKEALNIHQKIHKLAVDLDIDEMNIKFKSDGDEEHVFYYCNLDDREYQYGLMDNMPTNFTAPWI